MEPTKSITDLTYLKSLTGGASDKMSKYIRMFITGAPVSIQQMDMYFLNKDWAGLRQSAHALKPQLGYFGAKGAENLIKEIERMAGDQVDLDQIPVQLENFRKQYELIQSELEASLKELGN
ncbi:MAG: Hpt domain-containing protein [Bacteroidetes bacterium]|nr:Hpt domain-containing protein [Bacteroidota bacterium]